MKNERGFQACESNEYDDLAVLLFWSDAAYARRAIASEFKDCEPASIPLFDFLFRWLAL